MNKNERNNLAMSIKNSLFQLFSKEAKFSDFVLTDGTKITTSADDLEVGAEVYCLDDQGNQTPLDNGEYVVNDGRTIVVENNVIKEVKLPEDATEDETPVSDANTSNSMVNEKMEDGMADAPSEEGDLASRLTDVENHIEEILNMIKQLMDGTAKSEQQMMSRIDQISDEPGDSPVRSSKKGYEAFTMDKKTAKIKASEAAMEDIREYMNTKRNGNRFA